MDRGTVSTSYPYATLTSEAAVIARSAAERIKTHQRRAVIDVGLDLIAAKGALPYGQFERWLEAEFDWNERTARN